MEGIYKDIANELTRPARKVFELRKVVSYYPNDIWTADLIQITTFKNDNDGYSYMLCVLDVFSRYAWVIPLKDKTANLVLEGFKKIAGEAKATPRHLWTDEGKEFYNKQLGAWCKDYGIIHYSSHGTHKAVIAERFIRTIKNEMWSRFIADNTRKWVAMMPELVKQYNEREHSSTGMTPETAYNLKEQRDISNLWEHQYGEHEYGPAGNAKPAQFQVGQYVRISRKKSIFDKGYEPSWTMEIFKVTKAKPTNPWTYEIEDLKGEPVIGSFYEPELQATTQTPESDFLVEKVLQSRTVKGKKEVLVKWLGYSDKFNRWIPA